MATNEKTMYPVDGGAAGAGPAVTGGHQQPVQQETGYVGNGDHSSEGTRRTSFVLVWG